MPVGHCQSRGVGDHCGDHSFSPPPLRKVEGDARCRAYADPSASWKMIAMLKTEAQAPRILYSAPASLALSHSLSISASVFSPRIGQRPNGTEARTGRAEVAEYRTCLATDKSITRANTISPDINPSRSASLHHKTYKQQHQSEGHYRCGSEVHGGSCRKHNPLAPLRKVLLRNLTNLHLISFEKNMQREGQWVRVFRSHIVEKLPSFAGLNLNIVVPATFSVY